LYNVLNNLTFKDIIQYNKQVILFVEFYLIIYSVMYFSINSRLKIYPKIKGLCVRTKLFFFVNC